MKILQQVLGGGLLFWFTLYMLQNLRSPISPTSAVADMISHWGHVTTAFYSQASVITSCHFPGVCIIICRRSFAVTFRVTSIYATNPFYHRRFPPTELNFTDSSTILRINFAQRYKFVSLSVCVSLCVCVLTRVKQIITQWLAILHWNLDISRKRFPT